MCVCVCFIPELFPLISSSSLPTLLESYKTSFYFLACQRQKRDFNSINIHGAWWLLACWWEVLSETTSKSRLIMAPEQAHQPCWGSQWEKKVTCEGSKLKKVGCEAQRPKEVMCLILQEPQVGTTETGAVESGGVGRAARQWSSREGPGTPHCGVWASSWYCDPTETSSL